MTANKKEPDKKPATPSAAAGANRPHATIDLKAKDVTPEPSKPEASASADKPLGATAAADTTASGATSSAASTSGGSAPGIAANSSSSGTPSTSAASPSTAKTGSSGPATPSEKAAKPAEPKPSPVKPAPRGYGGFFTHLAAGIVGGIVALVAADILAGQLGLETDEHVASPAVLEQRLAALEAARDTSTVPPDVAARLSAAETKLGKLDELGTGLEGVSKKQGDLDKSLQAVSQQLAAEEADGVSPRIGKLEEQLNALTAAAGSDPQGSRIPQLAAITGKLADLESTVSNQLDALRKSVAQEVDTRLAATDEASQAARSGTQRIDRELSTLKAESAELGNSMTTVKTDNDRTLAALRTMQEDMKRLRGDIEQRLTAFAKPEDVTAVVSPIGSKLDALQKDVADVIKSEGDRKTTAERIVLSLELANLKRAIDRGQPFESELQEARRVAAGSLDLAPLDRFAAQGVPTSTELREEFKPLAYTIIEAEAPSEQASVIDRLLSGAKSVVRVRKKTHTPDDKSTEATVARMEEALAEDRLADVLQQAKLLPPPAQAAAEPFLAKVEAREAVDRAVTSVESKLKSSIAAAPADAGSKVAE